jgi:serine/threonine protein kinase/tetratricopeptide (TPR) repeat protein
MAIAQPTPQPDGTEALAEMLVVEMNAAWRRGERRQAEEYLRRHDELSADSHAAVRVIYEEVCLRQDGGEDVSVLEIVERFPQWKNELELLLECHDLLQVQAPVPRFSEIGETLGEFRLVADLGRGAQGRVFLAAQASLANRPVVLKMTPRDGQEHLSLARLQHTHIVPLYWAQDFPDRNLRVLCMPFLGLTTLQGLLTALAARPASTRHGRDILEALRQDGLRVPGPWTSAGSESQLLQRLSYVQAVCWIGACLADALDYAHQRGLIHLDLKPSNILLSTDGQPLILDFHLARQPMQAGEEAPEWLGGTAAYMSPEQRTAVDAVRLGRAVRCAVDRRSDIYSLGLLLYEALGGQRTEAVPRADLLPRYNPQVSPGLADIVAKCLAPDAAQRYSEASLVAEDLRRHREDRPLRGVANRSLGERWRKWRRRRPHALPLIVVAAALFAAVLSGGFVVTGRLEDQRRAAEAALLNGQAQLDKKEFAQAVVTFMQGKTLVEGVWGHAKLADALTFRLEIAQRAEKAQKLHEVADDLRFTSAVDSYPRRGMYVLQHRCEQVWQDPPTPTRRPGADLRATIEATLRADFLDLAVLWGDLRVHLAPPGESQEAHRQSLRILGEVEERFGGNAVLCRQQLLHARALSDEDLVRRFTRQLEGLPLQTAWEHYGVGRHFLQKGELKQAARELDIALEKEPLGFLPHFYRGVCAYRAGEYDKAAKMFTFCIGQDPQAFCLYYRGRAHAPHHPEEALRDFTQTLVKDPGMVPARMERGLLHYRMGMLDNAQADLTIALKGGADPAIVHYHLALIHFDRGRHKDARISLHEALRSRPSYEEALLLRKKLDDASPE